MISVVIVHLHLLGTKEGLWFKLARMVVSTNLAVPGNEGIPAMAMAALSMEAFQVRRASDIQRLSSRSPCLLRAFSVQRSNDVPSRGGLEQLWLNGGDTLPQHFTISTLAVLDNALDSVVASCSKWECGPTVAASKHFSTTLLETLFLANSTKSFLITSMMRRWSGTFPCCRIHCTT